MGNKRKAKLTISKLHSNRSLWRKRFQDIKEMTQGEPVADSYRVLASIHSIQTAMDVVSNHKIDCKGRVILANALTQSWKLRCNHCHRNFIVNSDKESHHGLSINKAVVAGAYASRLGYSGIKAVFAALELPIMSPATFRTNENVFGDVLAKSMEAEFSKNNAAEKLLAEEEGRFLIFGDEKIYFITVTVDGGWGKRSYGHSFNSNSGVAVIVGAKTGKVLFMDTRVKTCSACSYYEKQDLVVKPHTCYRNWNQSAQAMEAHIISAGFRESYEKHGLVYRYMIGDADASVFSTIQTTVVYPHRIKVHKIDCSNHAVRGLNAKIYSIKNNTAMQKTGRDMIKKHINRFGLAAISAIKYNQQNQEAEIKTNPLTLSQDIINIPAHIFGEHGRCKGYFNSKCQQDCPNEYAEFLATDAGKELLKAFNNLADRSCRIIYDVTSNAAEQFMALMARFTLAKRVNFNQRGSYSRRAQVTVISYNYGGLWFVNVFCKDKKVPVIWKKAHEYFLKTKCRSKIPRVKAGPFGGPNNNNSAAAEYGPTARPGEMSGEELAIAIEILTNKLTVTVAQRDKIEQDTIGQSFSLEWKYQRSDRLTASHAGRVYQLQATTNSTSCLKSILYPPDLSKNPNIINGILQEPHAKQCYFDMYGEEVKDSGIFISLKHGFLGASPDGLIGEDGIVEVKCVNASIQQVLARKGSFLSLKDCTDDRSYILKRSHKYYYQIIMQIYVSDKKYCKFIVYHDPPNGTTSEMFVEKIERNLETDKLWEKMEKKFVQFWKEEMAVEIVQPSFPYTKTMRMSDGRQKAIAEKLAKKAKITPSV